jgi:hypothetical protein
LLQTLISLVLLDRHENLLGENSLAYFVHAPKPEKEDSATTLGVNVIKHFSLVLLDRHKKLAPDKHSSLFCLSIKAE